MFREDGFDPETYNTAFLGQVRKVIENVFLKQADWRKAFLIPNYLTRTSFRHVTTKQDVLARFATIIGFIGMLRPHTITELQASMIKFVAVTGTEVIGKTGSHLEKRLSMFKVDDIVGFYITFKSKTLACARNISRICQSPPLS